MTVTQALFMAIRAMDPCDRGYSALAYDCNGEITIS